MKVQGIKILPVNNTLDVSLANILEEVVDGDSFFWVLLFLDGSPAKGCGSFLAEYKNRINNSASGLFVNWEDLAELNDKFFQIYEITLLASKNPVLLKRYKTEAEMYEKCELVIQLIDCSFWEVHTREQALILNLQKKFKKTELLS